MARRCLDCQQLIGGGSRCERHRKEHERARERGRGQRRSGFSRTAWAKAVKERDGYRCQVCGSPVHVEAHHRKPLAEGGGDTLANGITLCREHHLAAHRGNYGR